MPADGRFSVPYILVRGPDLGQDRGKAADLRGERTECAQGMTAGREVRRRGRIRRAAAPALRPGRARLCDGETASVAAGEKCMLRK